MTANHQRNTDVNSINYSVRPLYGPDVYTEIIALNVTITYGTAI